VHPVRVSLQVVGSVETLSTQLALVGLLSGVSSAMFPVVFLRKELFATKLAMMGFDLHVNPLLVIDQSRIGFERSSTVSTEVGLQFRVHRDLVDSQSSLPCKLFITLVTREGLLTCKEEFL